MIGRRAIFYMGLPCLVILILLYSFSGPDDPGSPLSPTAFTIDRSGDLILVAERTGNRVDLVNRITGEIEKSIETRYPPTGIVGDGGSISYITCSLSDGEVLEIDIPSFKVLRTIDAGHGAISPVLSIDNKYLFVANQYCDDISVIDIESGVTTHRIPVRRQPMTMELSADGRTLVVANFLPATRADLDTVTSEVSIIDIATLEVRANLPLSNGSNALRGLTVTPDSRYALISHNLGRFLVPTTQLEQGWMNTSALSVVDLMVDKVLATVLLDDPEKGAAGAWGVDVNDDYIVVSHSATHEISIINYSAFIGKLIAYENKNDLSYDLKFLQGIRKRIPVSGDGPRSIKITKDGTVLTGLYFSDIIEEFLIDSNRVVSVNRYILNPDLKIDRTRQGEMYFHDARKCFQGWQACTGCHPNDARTDGLNWDLLNDGIGNPKNCKSMLLSHNTPPAMITGIRESAEEAVRAGFRYIQFTSVSEEVASCVDLYLKSLEPVASPFLVDGELSDDAIKGKEIFGELKCTDCHSGPYYTDGKAYEIGTRGKFDYSNCWDTPTLIEVWRTGPWLHDGRSAKMDDLFTTEKHGIKAVLSSEDLHCLVEYVMSL